MFRFAIIPVTLIGLSISTVATAFAGELEKVDMVKEGINQKSIVVRANADGYKSYSSGAHRYSMRIYAKAKGKSNAIWYIDIHDRAFDPVTGSVSKRYYLDKVHNSPGWNSYSKSVTLDLKPENTKFAMDPIKVCTENMRTQVKKGMSKSNVLKREWQLQAKARFTVNAAADSKARNGKNDHRKSNNKPSGESKSRELFYSVGIICGKAA